MTNDDILRRIRGSGASIRVLYNPGNECKPVREEDVLRLVGMRFPDIKDIIFNKPATIIFWTDGTKTVVKCENEPYDPEKGMAMAISKKFLGNSGSYYEIFKEWLPEDSCIEFRIDHSQDQDQEYHRPDNTGSLEDVLEAFEPWAL